MTHAPGPIARPFRTHSCPAETPLTTNVRVAAIRCADTAVATGYRSLLHDRVDEREDWVVVREEEPADDKYNHEDYGKPTHRCQRQLPSLLGLVRLWKGRAAFFLARLLDKHLVAPETCVLCKSLTLFVVRLIEGRAISELPRVVNRDDLLVGLMWFRGRPALRVHQHHEDCRRSRPSSLQRTSDR